MHTEHINGSSPVVGMIAFKCSVYGCAHPSVARDMCGTHYKRFMRHGHILETRPSDWGLREKHPLYETWRGLSRKQGGLHADWADFWDFAKAVGDRPEDCYQLKAIDESKQTGPSNWYWRGVILKKSDRETKAESQAAYQRVRRAKDPWHQFGSSLKRLYGITVDTYIEMHDAQNGVCAICGEPEKSVDPKTSRVRRLAVDHCHTSGVVRGLLCSKCNTALGNFMDNPKLLENAIDYLNRN